MTVMPRFKTEATTTDVAYASGYIARLHGFIPCPHCGRRLRATAVRDGESEREFVVTCTHCHCDILTITNA